MGITWPNRLTLLSTLLIGIVPPDHPETRPFTHSVLLRSKSVLDQEMAKVVESCISTIGVRQLSN